MGLLDRVRGLLRSNEEIVSEEAHRRAAAAGADSIGECDDRELVTLEGTIEVLSVLPRQNTPWLEAVLGDGTGQVTLIWMGRHTIPGIHAGRRLWVHGRVSVVDGQRRIYNPRYELR